MSGRATETITLNASASYGGSDAPAYILLVDGQEVGSGTVTSNNVQATSFSVPLATGEAHTISIVYSNHTSSAQMLNVQSIAINGTTISSNSAAEDYVSSAGTLDSWGQMYFGGQVNFIVPASDFPAGSGTPTPTPTPTPTLLPPLRRRPLLHPRRPLLPRPLPRRLLPRTPSR